MAVNRARFHKLSNEFLASPALIFISGVITFPAGLAIVLTHNRWALAWPILITILGWLTLIAGVIRIVHPEPAANYGRRFIGHRLTLPIAAAIYLGIGGVLCFYGYYRR